MSIQAIKVTGRGLKGAKHLRFTVKSNTSAEFDLVPMQIPSDTEASFTVDPSQFMPRPNMNTVFDVEVLDGENKALAKSHSPFTLTVAAGTDQKPVPPASTATGGNPTASDK